MSTYLRHVYGCLLLGVAAALVLFVASVLLAAVAVVLLPMAVLACPIVPPFLGVKPTWSLPDLSGMGRAARNSVRHVNSRRGVPSAQGAA